MEIKVVRNILEENEGFAHGIRKELRARRRAMLNFMSSPGSGKTRLLEALIPALKAAGLRVGVIEGDITTARDAVRLQPLEIPIALVNTEYFGGDCHLAANVIHGALQELNDAPLDLVLIENVGNLVCPAEFDTGADLNIVLLSVTEGEDKPLKYPLMFRNSHVALINKVDLADAAETDLALMKRNMLQVNPKLRILETSGKKGTGIDELCGLVVELHRRLFPKR